MKRAVVLLVVQVLLVFGKPRQQRSPTTNPVHRVVKRAANFNPGFSLAAFRHDQLNLHNYYRQLHGVPFMTLDNMLNAEAQSYAEELAAKNIFRHCPIGAACNPSNAGENLAFAEGDGHTSAETNATARWYEEVFDYNYCSFPKGKATTRPGREGRMVGHFTQNEWPFCTGVHRHEAKPSDCVPVQNGHEFCKLLLKRSYLIVWYKSLKLGIGYARNVNRRKVYVVARYLSPGNYIGHYSINVPKAAYLLDTFQANCYGINGGLTRWSAPGACSKSCGKGVRYRTRRCTHPKPSFNGRDCIGETERLYPYWCNSQACPNYVNDRDEQCYKRGYPRNSYTVVANECVLYCKDPDPNRPNFYIAKYYVDDGTHCQNKNGACVDGICVLLGDEPATTPAPVPKTTNAPATTSAPPATTAAPATTSPPATTAAPQTTPKALPTTTVIPFTTPPPKPTTTLPATEPITVIPTMPNGGYSDWSQPGPCSKTCGGGISYRVRTCINPSFVTGSCVGKSRELVRVWCNPTPCIPTLQQRDQQCDNRGHEAEGHNFGGIDECYLYCRNQQTGYYMARGSVDTGTLCNKSTGACVEHACVPMKYAPGTVISGDYKEYPSSSYWKNIVIAIPNGATNVQIIHNHHDVEAVVGYRSGSFYGYDGSTVVKGIRVHYRYNSDITIAGPVNPTGDNQLIVYAIGEIQADITYKYTP